MLFEGDDRGVNVNLNLQGFAFDLEGLYWFDITINDNLLTRVPMRINYQPV